MNRLGKRLRALWHRRRLDRDLEDELAFHLAMSEQERGDPMAARRRLGVIREALHALTLPRFGKRDAAPASLSAEEHYRQLLGLPLDRRLSAPEIHRAFKRAAKTAHPDAGGDAQAFLELSAARDALMKQGIRYR